MRWLVIASLSIAVLGPTRHALAEEEPAPAAAAWTPPPKSSYEDQALQLALAQRKLTVDRAPAGKRVRKLHIVTLPVFSNRDWLLQLLNVFHWKTKEYIIDREVILRPGQLWNIERIKETERRLRDPIFTTLVIAAPIKSPVPGTVDLLVVTRDMWSLRLNSNFEVQTDVNTGNSVLSLLSLSLSENNVFGYRKQAAFVFNMNLSDYRMGPLYIDKNIAGTRLQLSSYAQMIFGRASDRLEGSTSKTVFEYPFWALATRWAGGIGVSHFDGMQRQFSGLELIQFETPDGNLIPRVFRLRTISLESLASRAVGHDVIHRFSAGYRFTSQRPELPDDFVGSAADRQAFIAGVLPRSENSSAPFVRYTMFTPVYHRYRNVDTYDLAEDKRLGPEVQADVAYGSELLGGDFNHLTTTATAGWVFDLAREGFLELSTGLSGRLQSGSLIDRRLDAGIKLIAPPLFDLFRIAGRLAFTGRFRESQNRFFQLGGDSGLRGYPIGAFSGTKLVVANLEARTRPVRIWFSRLGAVLFYDVGHVADRIRDFGLHSDVGVGLRLLLPQLSPLVYRFDLAFPLNGRLAGEPRFIAGVAQAF